MMLSVDWSCPAAPFGLIMNSSDREKGEVTEAAFNCCVDPTPEKVSANSSVLFTHVVSSTVQPDDKLFSVNVLRNSPGTFVIGVSVTMIKSGFAVGVAATSKVLVPRSIGNISDAVIFCIL
jgi:hypothetical protein